MALAKRQQQQQQKQQQQKKNKKKNKKKKTTTTNNKKRLPVCMNGWLLPSGSRWSHMTIPDTTAENCPGFPPPQDSPSVFSMAVKM